MLVALVAGSRVARAGEADAYEEPQSWYGWQTMLTDGGAIGLFLLSAAVQDAKYGSGSGESYEVGANVLVASGFAAYLFGGPAVHLAHGDGRKALGSFALRAALPIAGTLAGLAIGSAVCGPHDSEIIPCPIAVGALGLLAGGVAAPIVDASVIAREPVTPPTGPRLQAAFVPSGSGGTFLLAGRF
jgi:hypothetical protein